MALRVSARSISRWVGAGRRTGAHNICGGTVAAWGRNIPFRRIGVGRGSGGIGGDDDDDDNERNAEFGRMAMRMHAQNRKVDIRSESKSGKSLAVSVSMRSAKSLVLKAICGITWRPKAVGRCSRRIS